MFLDDKDDGYIPLKYKSKKDEEEETPGSLRKLIRLNSSKR